MKIKHAVMFMGTTLSTGSSSGRSSSSDKKGLIGVSADGEKIKPSNNRQSAADRIIAVENQKISTSVGFNPMVTGHRAATRLLERIRLTTIQTFLESNYNSFAGWKSAEYPQRKSAARKSDQIKGGLAIVVLIILCMFLLFRYSGN